MLSNFISTIKDLLIGKVKEEPTMSLTLVHDAFNINVSEIVVPHSCTVSQLYRLASDTLQRSPSDLRIFYHKKVLDPADLTELSELGIDNGHRLPCILKKFGI